MILVTGGNGFIGKYVCSVLSAHGKNVVALDRRELSGSAAKTTYLSVKCDTSNKDHVEQIFHHHSFDTVVHLASLLTTASRKNPADATLINIGGSLNILEAAIKFHVPKVIYGSSISAYGSKPEPGRDGVPETEPAAPEDIYGAAKRYVEILGDTYRQNFGVQFIALRISSVVGPGAVSTSSPWRSEIFEKLGLSHENEILFPYKSDESLPLVYVKDVADMFERLIDAKQARFSVYNTPSETWGLDDLASYIGSLDRNIRITFGQSDVSGIPRIINGQRFSDEFGYTSIPLKEHLRQEMQLS